MRKLHMVALLGLSVVCAQSASAGTVVVDSQSDLYRFSGGDNASTLNGIDPVIIDLGSATSITFSVTGLVSVNSTSGNNLNDPDGVGSAQGETNTGYGTFSGITAPTAGFLAGVVVSSAQRVSPPAALDFTTGTGTSFTSLSPLNSQVFFIGDGLTGDGTGTVQTFYIPQAGRGRQLLLGLTDACGYSGAPGCYTDNVGSFTVTYTLNTDVAAVPEPATWAMMLVGFGAAGGALRRNRKPTVSFA